MPTCLACQSPATHRGRCKACWTAYEARPAIRARRKRAAAIARGNDAAARKRAEIREAGWGACAACPALVLPSAVDVDHILPLAKGGEDIDSNIQVLCRPCHKAKTRRDFDYKALPF
jgi:5-methylcytosine-specific restriction protein A